MKKKHFFIGGPVSQTDVKQREIAKQRIRQIESFLKSQGHTCYCTVTANPKVKMDEEGRPKIAEKYLALAARRVSDTIRKFRAGDIVYSVAYWYWTVDEIDRADACIWVLSNSSSGSGAEIAWVLRDRKQCLVFFDRKESWTINGIVDRNLITAYWQDRGEENYETILRKFTNKVVDERNRILNVRLTKDELGLIDKIAKHRNETRSDFVRDLIYQAFGEGWEEK